MPFRHLCARVTRLAFSDEADWYARIGHRLVHGWLHAIDADLIRQVGRIQSAEGVRGSVGEIGVHHGKLFILLQLLSQPDEACFAVDLFSAQHLNAGESGQGDLSVFLRNIRRYTTGTGGLTLIERSSESVRPDDILVPCGPVRLFSVDGDHSATLTSNDLHLADACVVEGGVVILDDFFNPCWPGVSEGTINYLRSSECRLVPVAVGVNKVLLARKSMHARYQRGLLETLQRHMIKTTRMLGQPVAVFGEVPMRARLRRTPLWKRLRETPAGTVIRHTIGSRRNK